MKMRRGNKKKDKSKKKKVKKEVLYAGVRYGAAAMKRR